MRARATPLLLSHFLLIAACDAESRACREQMGLAQAAVTAVDPKSMPSVKASLSLVEQAHATCDKAKLGAEREQLLKAKNELTAHLSLLEARAARKKKVAPSKEELAKLVKHGDAACPKGQAYQQRETKQEVRCIGPQIVEMDAEAVRAYYGERRFRLSESDAPPTVRAELGSELYVFTYDKPGDAAPRCVTAYAAPGLSWQEVTARLSGVAPEKLKLGAPVKTSRGELALKVEHENDKPTIRLGQCAQP